MILSTLSCPCVSDDSISPVTGIGVTGAAQLRLARFRPLLRALRIHDLRNLAEVSLDALGHHNVIHGPNGSGKTSLLEAVHMLGMARSFRAGTPRTLVRHGQSRCTVFGEVSIGPGTSPHGVGVQREIDGTLTLRIAGETVRSIARLADELPLLLINAESFDLLIGQPVLRRRYLDWGVFHVEHEGRDHDQRFRRLLAQRNHLLRRGKLNTSELEAWDVDLARHGEAVSAARRDVLGVLEPVFQEFLRTLAPELEPVELRYRQGWDAQSPYLDVLRRGLASDREQGFTQSGPQRADLKVTVGGYPAADTLSRGQQKLVVCALKLAQGHVLGPEGARRGVYLVDDLPAELDRERCERVCGCLAGIGAQTLVTCVDREALPASWFGFPETDVRMFHVEHGVVKPDVVSGCG